MTFRTAIAGAVKALRQALSRNGVKIGGTASYPRVEIHSVVESEPLTKDNAVRRITCTIECVSDEKLADVISLTEGNIDKIFAATGLTMTGWNVIGISPGQVRMLEEQESLEQTKVIYRILQDVTVWVEQVETTSQTT